MGRKLDALLGRGFKTPRFKATVNVALTRLAVLKKKRQANCSVARSDVIEFLNTDNHDRALLRVEQVIKEQNMLDVFVMLERYCQLLMERTDLIAQEKVCPEELREAISSLIFASTRCGELPELQEIRMILTSRFGKEFASRAVELRNNCGVSTKIIQKLSTRMPTLETKMKVLKEIASENNIVLQTDLGITEEYQDAISSAAPSQMSTPRGNRPVQLEDVEMGEEFSGSGKMKKKYRDVADAAQAAFESAAYAAEAARAAVELSRSQSTDPDDPTSPNNRPRKVTASMGRMKSEVQVSDDDEMEREETDDEVKFQKIHHGQNNDFESVPGAGTVSAVKGNQNDNGTAFRRSLSDSSSDSVDGNVNEMALPSKEEGKDTSLSRKAVFDESDSEDELKRSAPRAYKWKADEKNEAVEGSSRKFYYSAHSPLRSPGPKMESGPENSPVEPLNINRRPISMRTRLAHVR